MGDVMAPIAFEFLKKNYPDPKSKAGIRPALFDELGWTERKRDSSYENTCAIRMSYCLIKSGVNVEGSLKDIIRKGPHKSKRIEISQNRLTKYLLEKVTGKLGWPCSINPKSKDSFIALQKQGIISFMGMYTTDWGERSGHIDLAWVGKTIKTTTPFTLKVPGSTIETFSSHDNYWSRAAQIYFWELP